MTAAVMQRVSLAMEAMEEIRRLAREACNPRRTGEVAAQITMSAIRAESQLEIALKEMAEAIRGDDEEEAAE